MSRGPLRCADKTSYDRRTATVVYAVRYSLVPETPLTRASACYACAAAVRTFCLFIITITVFFFVVNSTRHHTRLEDPFGRDEFRLITLKIQKPLCVKPHTTANRVRRIESERAFAYSRCGLQNAISTGQNRYHRPPPVDFLLFYQTVTIYVCDLYLF